MIEIPLVLQNLKPFDNPVNNLYRLNENEPSARSGPINNVFHIKVNKKSTKRPPKTYNDQANH